MALDACNFSSSVDAVLHDAHALQAFREWIRLDPSRPSDCLALHFAIKGYQTYLSRKEPNTSSMACTLHRKFISQRTGSCSFLPSAIRKEMSTRVHSLNSQQPPYPELFDPVLPALRKQLNALHSQFVASHSFMAFLARNSSEGSSNSTPLDELPPYPYLGPTSTLAREPARKGRGSKTRAYSYDASTSRHNNDSSRSIAIDRERNLFKHSDGSIRHDLPEARQAFVGVLTERLDVIRKELERCNENTYARDLPRDLAACSLLPSLHDNRILEETTSDEEVEKSMDYRFSDSSGFCSSESAYLSDRSFGKKKIGFDFTPNHLGMISSPRRSNNPVPSQSIFCTMQCPPFPSSPLTLMLREAGQPPMVAKIPNEMITLAKFRRTFGISRTENMRFLFKSTCEDGSAPFQWSLITDDEAILPLFDGKISAECRRLTDSD
ncbi:unnamed protein product [Nippostrongylus brasiliensis]|uniref:Axin-like protein 1 (inferred by orthology to a C. elegans protein) n=1 Tax=Nippostrongylus brasiliensis TaxID=27835 RepID=A0A0N4Y1S0_NIPBR|nr:unnamed protein product [Nippostrongylus brasiliensis]